MVPCESGRSVARWRGPLARSLGRASAAARSFGPQAPGGWPSYDIANTGASIFRRRRSGEENCEHILCKRIALAFAPFCPLFRPALLSTAPRWSRSSYVSLWCWFGRRVCASACPLALAADRRSLAFGPGRWFLLVRPLGLAFARSFRRSHGRSFACSFGRLLAWSVARSPFRVVLW